MFYISSLVVRGGLPPALLGPHRVGVEGFVDCRLDPVPGATEHRAREMAATLSRIQKCPNLLTMLCQCSTHPT